MERCEQNVAPAAATPRDTAWAVNQLRAGRDVYKRGAPQVTWHLTEGGLLRYEAPDGTDFQALRADSTDWELR